MYKNILLDEKGYEMLMVSILVLMELCIKTRLLMKKMKEIDEFQSLF